MSDPTAVPGPPQRSTDRHSAVKALASLAIQQLETISKTDDFQIKDLKSVGKAVGILKYIGTNIYKFQEGSATSGLAGTWMASQMQGMAHAATFGRYFNFEPDQFWVTIHKRGEENDFSKSITEPTQVLLLSLGAEDGGEPNQGKYFRIVNVHSITLKVLPESEEGSMSTGHLCIWDHEQNQIGTATFDTGFTGFNMHEYVIQPGGLVVDIETPARPDK